MLKHYNQTGYALILNQQGRIHQVLIDKIRYIELDRYLISVCTGESAQQESYEVVSPITKKCYCRTVSFASAVNI